MKEEEKINHPSFGVIQFSRVSGYSGYLFGSEIRANNYIELNVYQGEKSSDLTSEHYHERSLRPVVRLKMSPAQFSELITTLNYGAGTPCTLEVLNGKKIPQINEDEVESRKSFVNRKFRERMEHFADELVEYKKTAENLISKKTLSRENQNELRRMLNHMIGEISNNIPFLSQCFQEDMEKIVLDAKVEIDNTLQHTITEAGIKSLSFFHNRSKELEQ